MRRDSHFLPPSLAVRAIRSHDLRLLGAAETEEAQADDEQDEEQNRHQRHDGDVAGVGQRRRVGGLGRNHVGQVQHVAQRPAGIAAFDLVGGDEVSHGGTARSRSRKTSTLAPTRRLWPNMPDNIITFCLSNSR